MTIKHTPNSHPPRIAIGPHETPVTRQAVTAGGGSVVERSESPNGVVWLSAEVSGLASFLDGAPQVSWVQLALAGVDEVAELRLFDSRRTWTSAKGAYAEAVAEHALALTLAGLRNFRLSIGARSWGPPLGETLFGQRVTVLGAGGSTESLLRLLAPFRVEATVVRRTKRPVKGAYQTVSTADIEQVLPSASVVILMLALTPSTAGIIGPDELALINPSTWLINVARGRHIDTPSLVHALSNRTIGGAALDVTDPEPLPDGHPLWELDNCIITPHAANPDHLLERALSDRIRANVSRFARGDQLLGVINQELGY